MARVLGEVRLLANGRPVELGGPRQRRLLGALLTSYGQVVSTDRLIDAVFEGRPPEAAARTFRTYVSRLRRALDVAGIDGSALVVTVAPGYKIGAEALELDSALFESGFEEAQDRLSVGDADGALQRLDQALSLWTGSAYGEFASEEWAQPEAIRLEELRLAAAELSAEAKIESGRHNAAIPDLEALIAGHPLREGPRRLQILALYRAGRHAEALRAGRAFRSFLAAETGLEPTPILEELEQMVIERDPRLDAQSPGRKLRGYVLGEPLRETPMGMTFRASQPSVGRDVAITVVPAELADDPIFVRQFEVHAQRIAAIEHPNVVPLYDYWREPGGAYLVTRYLAGGTLRSHLATPNVLSQMEIGQIMDEVAAALAAAHGRGVVHGQLSPDSIMFDESGTAHLTEFSVNSDRRSTPADIEALASLAEQLWERAFASSTEPVDADPLSSAQRGALATVVRRAAEDDRSLGYATVEDFMVDFRQSIADPSTLAPTEDSGGDRKSQIEGPNPYQGLYAFQESAADVFFGRTRIIDDLVDDLHADGLVALIGPSGSGKSSVIRAGVIPRMRENGCLVAALTPGANPLAELGLALSRIAARPVPDLAVVLAEDVNALPLVLNDVLDLSNNQLLLVVDQFEEAFTLSNPEERELFLSALVHALGASDFALQVALTIRADFLGRVLDNSTVGSLVRDHSRLIAPLGSTDLHDVIVRPAEAAGVAVEPVVASVLVADASSSAGSLPLLQFALTELYERRVEGTMTHDVYQRIGGLSAVLTQRAEEIYGLLPDAGQQACRQLFTRLVNIDDEVGDTKRRALRSELVSVPDEVLERYGSARLIYFDRDPATREPTVELAHEALVREWPRLQQWINEDRDGLRVWRQLTTASTTWAAGGWETSDLWRGGRLASATDWAQDIDGVLSDNEREFLDQSQRQEEQTARADRRQLRRLRALLGTVAVVAAIAIVAGTLAVIQQGRASDERARAEDTATRADVLRLTTESTLALDEDPDLAILLALEANDLAQQLGETPGPVVAALQTATQDSRLLQRLRGASSLVELSPDGQIVASIPPGTESAISFRDVVTGRELNRLDIGRPIQDLIYGPGQGSVLVSYANVESGDGEQPLAGAIYDLASGEILSELPGPCCASHLEFSDDRRFLRATIYEPDGGLQAAIWSFDGINVEDPVLTEGQSGHGWTPDGRTVVFDDTKVSLVDPASGTTIDLGLPDLGQIGYASASPTDDLVVVTSPTGVQLWAPGASFPITEIETRLPTITVSFFSNDGKRLYVLGQDDEIQIVDVATGEIIGLRGHPGQVDNIATSENDSVAAAMTSTGDILVWDLSPTGPAALGNIASEGFVRAIEVSRDGSTVVIGENSGPSARLRRFNAETGEQVGESQPHAAAHPFISAIAAGNSSLIGSTTDNGLGIIEDMVTGNVVLTLAECELVTSMDDMGQWIAVANDPRCDDATPGGRLVEIESGAVLGTWTDRVGLSDFGPSGTIAQGLVILQRGSGSDFVLEMRRVDDDQVLAELDEVRDAWQPYFSADGRHISFGSGASGGWVYDVEALLGGAAAQDAVALNKLVAGGPTTFTIAGAGYLVTGHSNETLRFWDLETGNEWLNLAVDSGAPTMHAITADGRYHYYADDGGLVRRFPLNPEELVTLARARAQRGFTPEECTRYLITCERD